MPMGRARACPDLPTLLQQADFVTLHVPDTEQTRNMIGSGKLMHLCMCEIDFSFFLEQIAMMKKGSYLLNASRGKVVVIEALAEVCCFYTNQMLSTKFATISILILTFLQALKSGHLNGAAVDVYPTEPEENCETWTSALQGCPNTILTPHIGGSTEEAQEAIGYEVSSCDATSFLSKISVTDPNSLLF
jgi:D-3-phosphoglycerate dehydrogenase / 2-oxoglutarate reductase